MKKISIYNNQKDKKLIIEMTDFLGSEDHLKLEYGEAREIHQKLGEVFEELASGEVKKEENVWQHCRVSYVHDSHSWTVEENGRPKTVWCGGESKDD